MFHRRKLPHIDVSSHLAERLVLRPDRFSLFIKRGHSFNRIRPGGLGGHHLFGQVVGLPFRHVYLLIEMLFADPKHPQAVLGDFPGKRPGFFLQPIVCDDPVHEADPECPR